MGNKVCQPKSGTDSYIRPGFSFKVLCLIRGYGRTSIVMLGVAITLLTGFDYAQAQSAWVYEYTADDIPCPAPDFTFRGILLCRKQAAPISSRPVDGVRYQVGDSIGDAMAIYQGIGQPWFFGSYLWGTCWNDTGLITDETYYYTLFSYDDFPLYSPGVVTSGIICRATPTPMAYYPSPSPTPGATATRSRESSDWRSVVSLSLPPDVTYIGAERHFESITVRWLNPRDLVGWELRGTDCSSVDSGILTLDTLNPGSVKCFYLKATDFLTSDSYTVEFRMKVLQSQQTDGRLRFQVIATRDAHGGSNKMRFDFSESAIAFYFAPREPYSMDTTDDFHTYRLIAYHDYSNVFKYRFYVDGHSVAESRLSNSNPDLNGIYFGDEIGGGSISQWDYIRYCYGAYPYPTPSPLLAPTPSGTPTPSVTPTVYPTPEWVVLDSGDYNGDGLSDIAIFRPDSGLWAVQGLGRIYFGREGDIPVSGDYDGDGITDVAVFRPEISLWAIKDVTRAYCGFTNDRPVPGDYDGDGTCDLAIFRRASGFWYIPGITRLYFGAPFDEPVPGDFNGDGCTDIAVFRAAPGLWAIRGLTRFYFGSLGDRPLAGTYLWYGSQSEKGSVGSQGTIFRPATGLWAIRGGTRFYFGRPLDTPIRGNFDGNSLDCVAIFRPAPGLWAIRGITRAYFGSDGDIPVAR